MPSADASIAPSSSAEPSPVDAGPLERPVVIGFALVRASVTFARDSAALPADADAMLGPIPGILARQPSATLKVSGHTSSREKAGKKLGRRRADAVAKWLVDHGVPSSRFFVEAHGAEFPVLPPADDRNARAEVGTAPLPDAGTP